MMGRARDISACGYARVRPFALLCAVVALCGCCIAPEAAYGDSVADEAAKSQSLMQALAEAGGVSVHDFTLAMAKAVAVVTAYSPLSQDAEFGGDGRIEFRPTSKWRGWTQLTDDERSAWGSEDAYTSAQAVSLMYAYGVGHSVEEYYGTDGGTLDDLLTSKAESIGAWSRAWASGATVAVADIVDAVTDRLSLFNYQVYGASQATVYEFTNGAKAAFWAGGTIYKDGDVTSSTRCDYGSWLYGNFNYNKYDSLPVYGSSPAYYYCPRDNSFGDVTLRLGTNTNLVQIGASNWNGNLSYYNFWADNSVTRPGGNISVAMVTWKVSAVIDANYNGYYLLNALYNGSYKFVDGEGNEIGVWANDKWTSSGEGAEMVGSDGLMPDGVVAPDEYPAENVKGGGLAPDGSWRDLFRDGSVQPPVVPPEPKPNQYNPATNPEQPNVPQTRTVEWREETTGNILQLPSLDLSGLFPFSLVYDVQRLYERVQTEVVVPDGDYSEIVLPVNWAVGHSDELVLKLDDVETLGGMVRPVLQLLLAVMLVMSLVLFWRAILTGD